MLELLVGDPKRGDGLFGLVAHDQCGVATRHVERDYAPDPLAGDKGPDLEHPALRPFDRHLEVVAGLIEGLEVVGVVVHPSGDADQLDLHPEVAARCRGHQPVGDPGPPEQHQLAGTGGLTEGLTSVSARWASRLATATTMATTAMTRTETSAGIRERRGPMAGGRYAIRGGWPGVDRSTGVQGTKEGP